MMGQIGKAGAGPLDGGTVVDVQDGLVRRERQPVGSFLPGTFNPAFSTSIASAMNACRRGTIRTTSSTVENIIRRAACEFWPGFSSIPSGSFNNAPPEEHERTPILKGLHDGDVALFE
jgi:hypothetical protein